MAISDEFLKLFKNFVENYKHGVSHGYFTRRDNDYLKMVPNLEILSRLLEENRLFFGEESVLNYLGHTAIMSSANNPRYLACLQAFFQSYAKINTVTTLLDEQFHIKNVAETNPISDMFQQLLAAMVSKEQASELQREALDKELKSLRQNNQELSRKNKELQTQNDNLQHRLFKQNQIQSLLPQLLDIETQFSATHRQLKSLLTNHTTLSIQPNSHTKVVNSDIALPVFSETTIAIAPPSSRPEALLAQIPIPTKNAHVPPPPPPPRAKSLHHFEPRPSNFLAELQQKINTINSKKISNNSAKGCEKKKLVINP